MEIINLFIDVLHTLILIFIGFQATYLLFFALSGRLIPLKKFNAQTNLGSFVIYLPSYKEDNVIIQSAQEALNINYPKNLYDIVVIADSLQPQTIVKLKELPIQVVEVIFEKSTKAKALNAAINETTKNYDYALILDADNVCNENVLFKLNDALKNGYKVVQGQRIAKNTNTNFAILDAISEGINNHIFRKGHTVVGLSAAIIGSGVALEFALFKHIMPMITAVGGFDKEMELQLLKKKIKFGYAESALIYDEKVSQKAHFESQRKRWLSAQYHYFEQYFFDGLKHLFKGNFDYFDKVLQTLLLPRIMLLGIIPVLTFLSFILNYFFYYWLIILIITYSAIFISIPNKFLNKKLLRVIMDLPMAFMSMFKLFFKLKGANKTFIHTPHGDSISK